MEQVNAKSQSIADLIKNIDSGSLRLPEFQRDFVWEIDRTYSLFDSLVRDIFIGSIIHGMPSFEISVRSFDNRPRNQRRSSRRLSLPVEILTIQQIRQEKERNKTIELLLDGQQRTTAIYRAMEGFDKVWFIAKKDKELVSLTESFRESSLENLLYSIQGEEDDERISICLSDVWRWAKIAGVRDNIVTEAFNKTKYFSKISNENKDFIDERLSKYFVLKDKLISLINSEKLISYYLLDMSLEKFVTFFERSNSLGVQLNFIDILAAKLYAGGFNLKKKIDEFRTNNKDYALDPQIIVRVLAYVKSNGKEVNKNYILKELTAKDFNENWDKYCMYYKSVIDYLYQNGMIISEKWLAYDYLLIPMIILAINKSGDLSQIREETVEFIKFWYWSCIFSMRYSGSSNERVIEDSKILLDFENQIYATLHSYIPKISKYQITEYNDLINYDKKANPIYKGLFNLMNFKKDRFLNLNNTNKLSLNEDIDDHHIFPRDYVMKSASFSEDDKDLIDCVANRMLVPKINNIRINNKAPSEYLRELLAINSNLTKSLESHLVDSTIINGDYDQKYSSFIEQRMKSIFMLIKLNVLDKLEIYEKRYVPQACKTESIE